MSEETDKNLVWGGSGMTYMLWKHIRETYPDGSTIVELGAGSISTPRLAEFYNVVSFEHSEEWCNKVRRMLPKSKYTTEIHHAPLVNMFYDDAVIRENIPDKCDVVILDGPPYTDTSSRMPFVRLWYDNIFSYNAHIIIDDVHRDNDMDIAKAIAKYTKRNLHVITSDKNEPFHQSAVLYHDSISTL